MIPGSPFRRLLFVFALVSGCACSASDAASCVWKVTSANGATLYLGGSVHALRPSDYPLPAPYQRAFDASSRLIYEVNPDAMAAVTKGMTKAGQYPPGDSLKNHVDPRTYAYVRRYFSLMGVPEQKFNRYRPWLIDVMLEAAPRENVELGVERFFKRRAAAARKSIFGLESVQEHMAPFVGLSDREGETLLLVHFVNLGRTDLSSRDLFAAWRRGDADYLARLMHDAYRDFPSFADRIIGQRNRRWIPRIEGYLKSGQTCFVIAGAGHMGGSDGVVALLRARGFTVEQM
jgi:uncharacterized protein YbaP (TraB family)